MVRHLTGLDISSQTEGALVDGSAIDEAVPIASCRDQATGG
jgi:hypothetical protein